MNLEALQERHNKRMKKRTTKKKSQIHIPKHSLHSGSTPYSSGNAILHKTKSYLRNGKMKGAI